MDNTFIQQKLIPRLTFNPGLALTGFRTTRPWCIKLTSQERHWNQATHLTGDSVKYPWKGIFNFKNHTSWQKVKSVNHFVFLNFYFGAKNALHGNSLVVRRVSQGMMVLFWIKYAVPRQIKPGILKLTTSIGQRKLCTVFIFVSCLEKGCYRIVSLGHKNFDCRLRCGLSPRMQGSSRVFANLRQPYWRIRVLQHAYGGSIDD